jgi:dimethylargininase
MTILSRHRLNDLSMKLAILRDVSPFMADCELTHFSRVPIDINKAIAQHKEYEEGLKSLSCNIVKAMPAPKLPDSVFVEDSALVLNEVAIITMPGAESRRPETIGIAEVLKDYRPLHFIETPGTIDGGDVLVIDKDVFIGLSDRTNISAIDQVKKFLSPFGYKIHGVKLKGCLHLKSAITQVGMGTVLLNPEMVDKELFSRYLQIPTDKNEPFAANALLIDDTVIYSTEYPLTALRLAESGIELYIVDNSEVVKAEGGVTCCSIVLAK